MKIIFLDMDGVLNCYDTTDRIVFPPWNQTFLGLDNDKVQLLSKLVQETGAKVIISSSWRENCNRQRPMMADTESRPVQICDECYLEYYNAQDDRAEEENGAVHLTASAL